MRHNLTKIARDMRECHETGRPWRLPAMSCGEMGLLLRVLDSWVGQTD